MSINVEYEDTTFNCRTIREAEDVILDCLGEGNLPSSVFDTDSGKIYSCRWAITLEELNRDYNR